MIRHLDSLHWLQPGAVRQLHRYYQDAMTSCCSSRRTPLPSFGGTSVSLVAFAPRRTSAPPGPGVVDPVSPAGMSLRRQQDLPKFLGNLHHPSAMFQTDAGRTACTRPSSAAAWPLVIGWQRLPRSTLSTLNSMAFGLAVYASQDGLPHHHARLASSCWSGSTGRDSHPQGSDERFQICNLHLIPLSQTSWRTRRELGDRSPRLLKASFSPLPSSTISAIRPPIRA